MGHVTDALPLGGVSLAAGALAVPLVAPSAVTAPGIMEVALVLGGPIAALLLPPILSSSRTLDRLFGPLRTRSVAAGWDAVREHARSAPLADRGRARRMLEGASASPTGVKGSAPV